jgi:hypothetical protein
LWKNSVTREMMFKGNFLLWIVVEMAWFALQLGFISVLYLHTESIGTWTKWQVVLLVGTSHFIQQIFQTFFLVNCINLSELVRSGKLDFLLMLPINTRFLLSFRQVDLGGFINAASAVGVMIYAAGKLQLSPALPTLLGFRRILFPGHLHPLLPDVLAGDGELLDSARPGNRLRLLQSLQHRAHAGRCLSQRRILPFRVHLRAARVAGVQRAGAVADGTPDQQFRAALDGIGRGLRARFRMDLARLGETLHERQFVTPHGANRTR